MKVKKYPLVILSILLILLVFVSSASAADSNGTEVLSVDESTSTINENLALDYSPDTSGESNDTNIIENNENNLLSADNDESGNILREGTGTFADLQTEISTALSSGDYVKLTKDTYTYAGSGSQIEIGKRCTIDGNGAVIDMDGSNIRAFYVTESGVTIKNLTIKNANFNGNGGAIYFSSSGTVENCNFTGNKATWGGAILFAGKGSVTNCNFTNNTASNRGGAVYFDEQGTVTNCNFTSNQAKYGGAVYFDEEGTVTNCNFTNNTATNGNGGAVLFYINGNVTNCNFAHNSASKGGSILSGPWLGVTADTCIFKTSSDEPFNTRNLPPTLIVENFTTFYGSGEKLTFDLKTNSGIPVTNGNISISVYFKDNDSWVGNYSCLSGEGWIPDLPVGSYYAIFNTEYAEFQPINRTVTIMPNNTFWALNHAINANDNSVINLSNDYYFDSEYDSEFVNGVVINRPLTINGNGYTINALQKARIFNVNSGNVVLNNITFTNATSGSGGAVYFSSSGSVINCNFTGNKATGYYGRGGSIKFDREGTVTNCNFTSNKADWGGAVFFLDTGNVRNCNFTNNTATNGDGGAVFFMNNGNVTNCNFTNNKATNGDGGAIRMYSGSVENCNLTGNNATTGSAIYFYNLYSTDTLTISNSCFLNNRANAEALEVTKNDNNITITFTGNDNLLNAIYSNGEVTFTNVTYWSANGIANTGSSAIKPSRSNKEAGQNITLEIYDSKKNLVDNVTLVTDNNGQVTYDLSELSNDNYICNAYHIEDCYYTYAEYKDVGDFNILQRYINGAEENSVLTLDRNYTFTVGLDENLTEGIVIDKPLTINGNGHTINALEKARIFNINANNVVLNNITFTNATASGSGGAVYFSSSGSVINCNFINNTATNGNGGAIRMSSGSVTNCNFTNNTASRWGGAIDFEGDGTVTNCNFTGNKATGSNSWGGAIWMGSGSVTNCNFIDNFAPSGGAIWFTLDGNVTNCNFTANQASRDGGAVYFWNEGTVTNCNFTNNTASGSGGAIYFDPSGTTHEVRNCNFTANQATGNGGAIFMSYGSVKNCNFTGNKATGSDSWGGAVFFIGTGNVTNCNFTNNTAQYGGAIRFNGEGTVTNCNFTANQASREGGAVYFLGEGTVTNCNFTGNNATTGSAIFFYKLFSSDTLTISNSTFLNNRANAEDLQVTKNDNNITITFTGNDNLLNAIYSRNDAEVTFTTVTYWSANGITNTGSSAIKPSRSNREAGQNITVEIYDSNGQSVDNVTLVTDENGQVTYELLNNENCLCKAYHIEDCYYTYAEYKDLGDFNRLQKYINEAEEYSTLTLYRNYTFTPGFDDNLTNGIVIDKALTINGNGYTIDALQKARIFNVNSDNVVLNNITFINAITSGSGGAVYFSSSGSVINCNFTANQASREGGAIYFSKDGGVTNCNFTGNKATGSNSWGGAIYMSSGSVENCNFINNTATNGNGGAIRMYSGSVTNCNFTANQASRGGAVFFWDEGTVTNCNFTDNTATNGDGGAIRMSSGSVTNCNFTGNKATGSNSWGGAIYMSSGSVENCNFINNTATNGNGGAVYFYSNGNVTNCNFTANQASVDGGAVYFDEQGTVTNCNFTGNNATTGSAIYFYKYYSTDTLTISNSTFLNNRANAEALEVTKNENNITITFTGNDNLLNAICSRNDAEVTFTNVTYWSAKGINNTGSSAIKPSRSNKEAGQNITVSVIVNDKIVLNEVKVTDENGTIVLPTIAGDNYFIGARHDTDSYYTEKVNTTLNNTEFNVNVTSQTTNNKTVNITAKSNIPNEVIKGKLLFILPNGTEINATYATNGTWWALHTFDDVGDYNISASYIGLDDVIINNGNISIRYEARVDVNNKTLNLEIGQNFTIVATTTPEGLDVTFVQDDSGVYIVDENGNVIALKEGKGSVLVKVGGDGIYAKNSTIVNVTVSKVPTEITVLNDTLVLEVSDEIAAGATLTPPDAGNLTYSISNSSVVKVEDGKIIALAEGEAVITVSFEGDKKYLEAENKTINVTVNKIPTEISIDPDSLDLFVGDETVIAAALTPADAGNVTFTSSDENIVTVDTEGNVIAQGKGTAIITVSFAGDNKYAAAESKKITVNVSLNDASVTVDNDTLNLKVDETYKINATKHPDTILLDITYTSSDETIATVDEKGVVTAIGEGTAIITLSVGDDEIYAKNSTTVTVTVSKIPTEITIANATVTLNVDDEVSTGAALNPEKAGNLTYKSGDESVAIVKDGKIIALKEGNAIITVSFEGNNKYASAENKTIKVTVKKLNLIMDVSADEITEGENATISVTLPGDATGNVTAAVNGKTYSSKVKDGKAIITIPDLEYGDYTIPVNYSGDDKYNPSTKDVNLTVKEDEITVSAPDLTQYYSGPEPFIVNVTYARGVPVEDKEVKITINGVTYIKTTDENGIASLSINLNSKTYDVTTVVDNITVNSIVTILPTIEAEDIESKSKNIVFTATFLDSEGKYLTNGTKVSFNIGGVIYNAQVSGDKGLASVDLILDRGRYLITSQNTVTYENAVNSIAVDLKDAEMIISGDEITVGENATISTTLPSDATGNVTATINGKTYMGQVKNGKATITIPDLSAGNYTASVTYSGDYNYNSAKGDANITVNKINASMTVDAHPITAGENATVTVTLPSDATGNVTIGNEIIPVKDGAASAVLTDLPVGTNTVPITYSGDDKYNPTKTNVDVVVNEKPTPAKENLTIKASAEEITEGENAAVIVTGLENATGNVSTNINGKTYISSIEDGKANITVPGLIENVTAVVNYPGDDKYNPAMTTVNITVNRNTVTINAQNLTKNYKDPQKFTVKVTDAKGQAAPNKTVEITINGVTYKRTTDENGTASLNINLGAGEYPVSITVDDVTVNSTVTVKSTIDASDVIKMFRNDTQYNATFTDANGTPLANTQVSFNINGIIYNRTTDANGTAKMNINMGAGDYIITATNPVTGEMKSNSIKVISLIESDDLTKYYKNASQFVVRIHTADGGYVGAGEEVRFNINGVFYTRTTNATGHAKLNINLPQGNYTITTYYKDCSQGNNIEVLPILSADDLVMKYRDGSQFKAKLVDGQGKAYPGQTVQFNINGVLYNRVTGSDGIAKLNINLMSGEYIITSSYNGANIANKITIRG